MTAVGMPASTKDPRRKVVSSYKSGSISSNYFSCTLECGHTVTAYGRRPMPGYPAEAPKACSCHHCGHAARKAAA